jgi:hypothetical protein
MNIKSRVEKVAAASGIDRPCWLCTASSACGDAFNAYMRERGVPHPPSVWGESRCIACGLLKRCDTAGLSDEANAARLRVSDALADYKAGRVDWATVDEAWREYEVLDLSGGVKIYGEHYHGARAVMLAELQRHLRDATDEQLLQVQPAGATLPRRV